MRGQFRSGSTSTSSARGLTGDLFVELVRHIRAHGYTGRFFAKSIIHFDEDGLIHWTMGAPIEEPIIVNRCGKEQTYEYRLFNEPSP